MKTINERNAMNKSLAPYILHLLVPIDSVRCTDSIHMDCYVKVSFFNFQSPKAKHSPEYFSHYKSRIDLCAGPKVNFFNKYNEPLKFNPIS